MDVEPSTPKLQNLKDNSADTLSADRGILQLGLMFEPSPTKKGKKRGILYVNVQNAKSLPQMDTTGFTDGFVKMSLLSSKSKKTQTRMKKTNIVKKDLNPVWNEKFAFTDVTYSDLCTQQVLELTVWDHDILSSNDFIGGLRLGPTPSKVEGRPEWMDSSSTEAKHWEDMLACPEEWVEFSHSLRASMVPRVMHDDPSLMDQEAETVAPVAPSDEQNDEVFHSRVTQEASAATSRSPEIVTQKASTQQPTSKRPETVTQKASNQEPIATLSSKRPETVSHKASTQPTSKIPEIVTQKASTQQPTSKRHETVTKNASTQQPIATLSSETVAHKSSPQQPTSKRPGAVTQRAYTQQRTSTTPGTEVSTQQLTSWSHETSPCTAMLRYSQTVNPPTPDQVAAWFPNDRKWPTEDVYVDGSDNVLIVYLMDDCPDKWKYHGNTIKHRVIMDILNSTWKRCFVLGDQAVSHIRVTFQDKTECNWSALGSLAKLVLNSRPTMSLNFSNMSNEEIEATVVHQFGHALGLGHALMKPDDWEVLKPYLNVGEMEKFYGSPDVENFEVQWTGKGLDGGMVNYDEKSVMQYRTNKSWLKEETLRDVSEEVTKKVKMFHEHARLLKVQPSPKDLKTKNIGLPAMTLEDLFSLENKIAGTTYHLTNSISPAWRTIGQKLGAKKKVLKTIKDTRDTDDERLGQVWHLWFNNIDQLSNRKKYPPSWKGLRKLLADSGKRKVAKEFFEYIWTCHNPNIVA